MKPNFIRLIRMLALSLVALCLTVSLLAQPGTVTAPPGTSMIPSHYVDTTIADDPVFIFCSPDANGDTLLGTLSILGGASVNDFVWMKYNFDPNVLAWENFDTIIGVASSTVSNLETGLYMVHVMENPGSAVELHYYRRAHVIVNETLVDFDAVAPGCQPFTLTNAQLNAVENSFTIYDPPAYPMLVDSTTQVEVCFWADHTYVSDLGFYLLAPDGERVDLMPSITAWDQGPMVTDLDISVVTSCSPADYYTNCNSGNDVNNFCFTSVLPAGNPNSTPCICDMPTPLTGTYSSCDSWEDIEGNDASTSGWAVQIFDCTPADIGYLQRVTLSFTGNTVAGLQHVDYDSGPINVAINDNSCDPFLATTYEFAPIVPINQIITEQLSAEWSSSPLIWNPAWGPQDLANNLSPIIDPIPSQTTDFCLSVTSHLYDAEGNEITTADYPMYFACSPIVCHIFEPLTANATIISYPYTICQNAQPVQLLSLYPGGAWSSNSGTYPNGPITTNGMFFPNLANLGNITITYSLPAPCADTQSVVIEVVDAPVISDFQETCYPDSSQYAVSFYVSGGNPGSYQILNCSDSTVASGTWTGPTWTSQWILSGDSYCYIVSDHNDCNPTIVSGTYNCNCTCEAGDMPTTPLQLCETDQANVQVLPDANGNPTYTLDANDGYEYFLHTYQFGMLGNVVDHNTTGIFAFSQSSMSYNQTYYISQVVGNNLGTTSNPVIDIFDPCLSVAQGTPVIWDQLPLANAGQNDSVCGKIYQLNADSLLSGTGSWSCLSAPNLVFSPSPYDPNATVEIPYFDTNQYGCFMNTTYLFRWIVANGVCEAMGDVEITFMPIPEIDAGDDTMVCGYEATLNGTLFGVCAPPFGSSQGFWEGPGAIANWSSLHATVDVYSPGTFSFIRTENNGMCSNMDTVDITFLEMPMVSAGVDDTIYGNQYSLDASSTMGGGLWTGPINSFFVDPYSPQTMVEISFNGYPEVMATFVWTEQNQMCVANDSVDILFINTSAIASLNVDDQGVKLYQNQPNPFSNKTEIMFYLPKQMVIDFEVLNMIGERISIISGNDRFRSTYFAGVHTIVLCEKLPAGTYFYRLSTPASQLTKKMIVIE